MSPDGANKRVIAEHVDPDVSPAWAKDGSMAAFFGNAEAPGLWVVNHDGSNLHRIVTCDPKNCRPGDLAWSRRGTELAFVHNFDLHPQPGTIEPASSLEVTDLAGGPPRVLCGFPHCGQGLAQPDWSSDGTDILFSNVGEEAFSGPPAPLEIFAARADGSGVTGVDRQGSCGGHPCSYDRNPIWAPDGVAFAFFSNPVPAHAIGSNTWEVVTDTYGTHAIGYDVLTTCAEAWCRPIAGPVWSLDGRSVSWSTVGDASIFTAEYTGPLHQIRTCGRSTGCAGPTDLTLSPDGRSFAFLGSTLLFSIRLDGTGMRELATGVAGGIAWLPAPQG